MVLINSTTHMSVSARLDVKGLAPGEMADIVITVRDSNKVVIETETWDRLPRTELSMIKRAFYAPEHARLKSDAVIPVQKTLAALKLEKKGDK